MTNWTCDEIDKYDKLEGAYHDVAFVCKGLQLLVFAILTAIFTKRYFYERKVNKDEAIFFPLGMAIMILIEPIFYLLAMKSGFAFGSEPGDFDMFIMYNCID